VFQVETCCIDLGLVLGDITALRKLWTAIMTDSPPTQTKGLGLGVTLPSESTKPAPRTTTPTTRTNPISLRLWKIISTSANGGFDDPASKEALEIISERYCGAGITRSLDAKRGRRKKGNAGAHWLGEDAVRRAGLAIGEREQSEGEERYYSTSEEEDDEEDAGSDTSRDTPASSIRPGILSRNQSSSTSIRSVHGGVASSSAAAAGDSSLVAGATNAKRYFKRDLEAGLVSGSLRFLKAFEKVDDVGPPSDILFLGR
jgi:hypothetical protein